MYVAVVANEALQPKQLALPSCHVADIATELNRASAITKNMLQGCVLYELRTPTQEKLGVFAGYEDAFRVALTQHSDRPAVEVWRTFNIDRSERYVTVLFPMIENAIAKGNSADACFSE